MVGRGHHDGVESALRQQFAILDVLFRLRRQFGGFGYVAVVDFGDGDAFGAELEKILRQVAAPAAGPDEPEGKAVIGAPGAARDE